MTYKNKINVDEETDSVAITVNLLTEDYLKQVALRKITNDKNLNAIQNRKNHVIQQLDKQLNLLKIADKAIINEFNLFLKNRKTTIKKRVKTNVDLNNLLAKAFSKEFTVIDSKPPEKGPKIQNTVVEEVPNEEDK